MLDRRRSTIVACTAVLFLAFGLLTFAVVQQWAVLDRIDDRGNPVERWVIGSDGLTDFLRVIEVAFDTIGLAILTAITALALWAKKHRRAAYFTVLVSVATFLSFTLLKLIVGRDRPAWQFEDALLATKSFPSGHATSITAFGGILVVLVVMLVRRANLRRLAYVGIVLVVLLVCADRVLLGRHYVSDVIGGVLLGSGLVLLGLLLFSPLPRSHAAKIAPLAEAVPSRRRLAVILNPIKVEDVDDFKTIVSRIAARSGWSEPTWRLTTVEDSGTGQAHDAAVAGADLVIVCGGDGTVREVCAELAGTGIPVGIIPAGTGNLLARNLDLPLYIRAAIDVALTGQDRAIDMVRVTGDGLEDTHFMVMAGMGFDAALMEGVNDNLKKKVGWLAYIVAGLKSLMFPAVKVEISMDGGEPTLHRARTVMVGNVGYLQAGMPLLPDAAIDDGVLDVVILHPRRFLSWIPLSFRVLAKRSRVDDTINRMTGQRVSIKAASEVPRQLDGDSVGAGRELHAECIHGRLLVRVPR
ncbi:hypothetical protein GCM10027020_32120 [Nocardioides salsibiostraticola]